MNKIILSVSLIASALALSACGGGGGGGGPVVTAPTNYASANIQDTTNAINEGRSTTVTVTINDANPSSVNVGRNLSVGATGPTVSGATDGRIVVNGNAANGCSGTEIRINTVGSGCSSPASDLLATGNWKKYRCGWNSSCGLENLHTGVRIPYTDDVKVGRTDAYGEDTNVTTGADIYVPGATSDNAAAGYVAGAAAYVDSNRINPATAAETANEIKGSFTQSRTGQRVYSVNKHLSPHGGLN